VVLMPIIAALLTWVIRKAYPLFAQVQDKLDNLNTVMQENLSGVRVVKAFVRAAYEIARFGRANDNLMDHTVGAAPHRGRCWPVYDDHGEYGAGGPRCGSAGGR
jgi:ATP-binding cassette subfamily B protein